MDMTIEQMLSNYATNASILGVDAAKESFYSELDALVASDEAMESPMSAMWSAVGNNVKSGSAGRVVGGILLAIPALIVSVIEIVLRIVVAILHIVAAIVVGVLALPVLIIGLPIFGIAAASSVGKVMKAAAGFKERAENGDFDEDEFIFEVVESVGVATEASAPKIKLNPTALSAAKSYQKSLNVMLKSSFETSQMISKQIESMKKGSDKLDDMQHKAESLKAVFTEVSKQKAAYDKAMQSVGATGKEKGLYWNREEVNNMKSLAKTITNESKRQQKFLEKFKAKCEKTLSAAKAANAKGEKNMKLSPEMINADKETVKMCNVYLSVVKLCQKSVEITKTALVDAGAKKDKTEDKPKSIK